MSLLEAFALSSFWALGLGLSKVEQFQLSISTEIKKSIDIPCKISSTNFETDVIHWYRQKPNQALEHLIYIALTKSSAGRSLGKRRNKLEARKNYQTSTSILTINSIEKEDTAVYYCAAWEYTASELLRQHAQDPLPGSPPTTSFPTGATTAGRQLGSQTRARLL
ncbi:putative non-functional T cell receptor gamma variable 10 [Saguinus oedipus]|nr:putative non-functional T cell receptor gamma variable 10 [Saguinus oedipus]